MRLRADSWQAWLRGIAFFWMGFASYSMESIEGLIPAIGYGVGLEALARLILASKSDDPARNRLHACFGLAISASIFLRPSYSILTLSFVLLMQALLWLVGDGVFQLWGAMGAADGAACGEDDAHAIATGMAQAQVAAPAIFALGQIGLGIGLHLWPGAGALDRGPILAIAFFVLGLASCVQAINRRRTEDSTGNEQVAPRPPSRT